MNHRSRSLKFLFLSILSLAGLVYLLIYVPPTLQFPILNYQLSILLGFLLVLFLFLFSTFTYIFKSPIHGILIGLLVVIYLIFRLSNLTHPFFAVLLLALFLVLELMFTYKK